MNLCVDKYKKVSQMKHILKVPRIKLLVLASKIIRFTEYNVHILQVSDFLERNVTCVAKQHMFVLCRGMYTFIGNSKAHSFH